VDVNFAPVMDVDTNADNPVIGDRSLGRSPQSVAQLGNALIGGMQANGVAACAKHFPGHGDTAMDSHLDLPHLPHDLARLEAVELAPFAAAVMNNVAAVMSAHVLFDALDDAYPATMSGIVLEGILRKKMGFDGVVFSDCLQMKAIADHYGVEQAVVRGANAGVDAFLVCHDVQVQLQAMEALAAAVRSGDVPLERIEQANARLDKLCKRYARPPVELDPSQLKTAQALAVASEIERLGGEEEPGDDPTEKTD
jgi:beta-N-acetylhexosaminidase